jgi:hypothetical protein
MKTKISEGNMKLGRLPNVSIPPVVTCANSSFCRKDCYALKAYRMYPRAKEAWKYNYKHLRENRDKYFQDIHEYLEKKTPRLFRWHAAGDILDQDYIERMKRLAESFPEVKFLAFTKMTVLKFSNLPKNLVVVYSAWPGMPFHNPDKLPVAFMQDGTETRVSNAIECPGNCETCGMCWELPKLKKNVVFHKH